ncbi:hypothetical protein V6N13_123490 [Hibiscus sabdariffa]
MIDPDYICYPTIVAFIEGVGIPKQNIEYLAYLEPCFSLDGGLRNLVEIEKNEDGYVLRESEAVGHVLGEIEAVGPLYEDTNFVGPVLGERDYGDNIGSEKVGRSVNANSNDIITDTVESDEDDDSESEDLSVERWLSDEDDEEISQIFNNKRKFKSRNLGDEHQEAQPKRTATDSQGKEASVEDESSDTDYIESDDPGSYKTYFEGELCVKKGKKLFFDDKGEVPRIELGIIFENPKQFKEALGAYAVAKRFDFRANYRFVGKHFLSKLKILSNLKLKDMMRLAKDELKVELNKNLCQRARVWANQKISGRLEDEFKKLFDYVYTLREVDPNGAVGRNMQMILPNAEHRFCAQHMYANSMKENSGHDMQQLFWTCCKATNEEEFHKHSARIATLKDTALSSPLKRDPKHWSKANFQTHSKCDVVDNNFGEAFNSTIIYARYKSIISLFEDIRHYVMNRNIAHKHKCEKWEGLLCPKIAKLVENHKVASAYCHVTWNGQNGCEVYCNGNTYVVDLQGHKCRCRCWDLTVIDVSQPPALNPSQPTTTDVSQPPAPNPSQPTTSQASQPQFPNSRNTSTRTKSKASYGR